MLKVGCTKVVSAVRHSGTNPSMYEKYEIMKLSLKTMKLSLATTKIQKPNKKRILSPNPSLNLRI